MPVSPRLQKCLSGIEFVAPPVGGELNCQRALKHVKTGRYRMDHSWSNNSGGMVTTFEKMTGFGVEGYSSGSPAMVWVSADTSTKLAEDARPAADKWPSMAATAPTP